MQTLEVAIGNIDGNLHCPLGSDIDQFLRHQIDIFIVLNENMRRRSKPEARLGARAFRHSFFLVASQPLQAMLQYILSITERCRQRPRSHGLNSSSGSEGCGNRIAVCVKQMPGLPRCTIAVISNIENTEMQRHFPIEGAIDSNSEFCDDSKAHVRLVIKVILLQQVLAILHQGCGDLLKLLLSGQLLHQWQPKPPFLTLYRRSQSFRLTTYSFCYPFSIHTS